MDLNWSSSMDHNSQEKMDDRKYIFMPEEWLTEATQILKYKKRVMNYKKKPITTGFILPDGTHLIHKKDEYL